MTNDSNARFFASRPETLGPEDFETASIHSAAPSYISEAPSYHSTVPNTDPIPPYTPRTAANGPPSTTRTTGAAATLSSEPVRSRTPRPQAGGLPPIPPLGSVAPQLPSLSQFRIPTWSTFSANPTARHYHSVASRRVARETEAVSEGLRQLAARTSSQASEPPADEPIRPLEDPYLVGEEAARKARAERLARENGDDILIREDRRWDLWLGNVSNIEERDRPCPWPRIRPQGDGGQRMKLAGRLGGRLMML